MKKLYLIITIVLLFVLVGCQSNNANLDHNSGSAEINSTSTTPSSTESMEQPIEPPSYIGIRSLTQLDEMRSMLKSSEQELSSYLLSVEGGGTNSREDLENFLELIASLPNLELVDGDIVWIAHYKESNVVYVSTMASNGDWTRVEYILGAKDIPIELEKMKSEGIFDKSTITDVIQCKGGRVKIFSETSELHPSGTGKTVEWMLTVDSTLARVVYFTADSRALQSSNVFESASLTNISIEQESKK